MASKHLIQLDDSYLEYYRNVLSSSQAQASYQALQSQLIWQQEHIQIFGKTIASPRLQCFCGDPGIEYRYSGRSFTATPWNDTLLLLKQLICNLTGHAFNGVLCNLYRDGQDAMGWHSDNEPELGPNPVIASLSLGQQRNFSVRKHNHSKQCVSIPLAHNSLLLMPAGFQTLYQHSVPRSKRAHNARINLTFRMFYN